MLYEYERLLVLFSVYSPSIACGVGILYFRRVYFRMEAPETHSKYISFSYTRDKSIDLFLAS